MSGVTLGLMAAVCALPQDEPVFTRDEMGSLQDALFAYSLTLNDLRALDPRPTGNPFIDSVHENPAEKLHGMERTLGLQNPQSLLARPLSHLRKTFTKLGEPPLARRPTTDITLPPEVPASLQSPLIRLIRAVSTAQDEVRASLETLSAEERRDLIEGLPRLAVHPSLATLDFVSRPMRTEAELQSLVAKVDVQRINYAAERLYGEVDETFADLNASTPPSFRSKLKFTVDGVTVVFAGLGNDVHDDRDATLTVDLGGDDRYSGRHGAGIGYASVFVDLAGNDRYDLPDVSLGAGLLGVGLAWDLGGKDEVHGKSLCAGAGVGGVGVFRSGRFAGPRKELQDDEGDEVRSKAMSQGFGFYGVGACVRSGGQDHYRSEYLSQGAALRGGIGWMSDLSGGDTFGSAGLAPMLESDRLKRSRSQGFGFDGGIGVLLAKGEGAELSSGSEAQGCGLVGGVGLALASSTSRYRCTAYGLGYGEAGGIGAALGGTEFVCRIGAGLGTGVTSGVGFVEGSRSADLYASSSGCPASGIGGGLGLLLDFGGSDQFAGAGWGGSSDLAHQGLGLLLKLGGPNYYSQTQPSGTIRQTGLNALIAEFDARAEESIVSGAGELAGVNLSSGSEIAQAVAEASGEADYAPRSLRVQSKKNLSVSMGRLLDWLQGLPRSLTRREAILLGSLVAGGDADLKQRLGAMMAGAGAEPASNATRVAGAGRIAELKGAVRAGLKRRETEDAAVEAAYALRDSESVPDLLALTVAGSPRTRRMATAALAEMGGSDDLATAQALLANPDRAVRLAAIAWIGRLKPASIEPLQTMARSSDERVARSAIQALGAVGSPEALQYVGTRLGDLKPGIRIEALRALAGRCPSAFLDQFAALRNDPDRRVRGVALGLDPGF